METICIPVPMPDGKPVQMEVTIDGEMRLMQYRVECLRWPRDADPDTRFQALKHFIQTYDDAWSLVQVGAPGAESMPITFRRVSRGKEGSTSAPADDVSGVENGAS